MNRHLPIPVVLLLGFSTSALAQLRCDCTSVVDSCEASVAVRGGSIEITTDHRQCSRVDYFVDGQPFVSLVLDGESRQNWAAPTDSPRVLVQSCQVCLDSASPTSEPAREAQPSAAAPGGGALEALIEVSPTYPLEALGVSGYVDVEVTVGPQGIVERTAVAASQPPGVFDRAAVAAVARWRYPAEAGREPVTLTERIEFRSPPAPEPIAPVASTSAERAARGGPRNQCVREASRFNFGDAVEVGLINACDMAIMVFGCAEGTGRYRGRWVCTTSEQQRNALVRTDDARTGETMSIGEAGEEDFLQLTLTDRIFLSRAPNTEYWWLACGIEDESCRSAARQWVRSLDRQLANADPQGRTSEALARSY